MDISRISFYSHQWMERVEETEGIDFYNYIGKIISWYLELAHDQEKREKISIDDRMRRVIMENKSAIPDISVILSAVKTGNFHN